MSLLLFFVVILERNVLYCRRSREKRQKTGERDERYERATAKQRMMHTLLNQTNAMKIFTRMGSGDDIAAGKSSFLCEMSETQRILARATPRSFALLDELGRGTATHDGTALAAAVLGHFLRNVRCPLVFITHYPQLLAVTEQISGGGDGDGGGGLRLRSLRALVKEQHMSFIEEDDDGDDNGDGDEGKGEEETSRKARQKQPARITFLFKAVDGNAGRSYGLNVARLAGLPHRVVSEATRWSSYLEERVRPSENARTAEEGEEEEEEEEEDDDDDDDCQEEEEELARKALEKKEAKLAAARQTIAKFRRLHAALSGGGGKQAVLEALQ